MGKLGYIFSDEGFTRPYCFAPFDICHTKDNACIVFDGCNIIYAGEAERFSKIKHDYSVPTWALDAFCTHSKGSLDEKGFLVDELESSRLQDYDLERIPHSHHENHIFEVFYQSGFKESAVMVNDGVGTLDECITLAYMQEGKEPQILKKFDRNQTPSGFYGYVAEEIFGEYYTEGKLMGLAAYGSMLLEEPYIKWFNDKKLIHVDMARAGRDIKKHFEKSDEHKDVMLVRDIAFTVQKNYEDTIVQVVRHFKELLNEHGIKTKNLCMSGGGVLNCPTNSKIIDLELFEHYYASPQPSDGCAESIGAAFCKMHDEKEALHSQRLKSAYLGTTYCADELILPHTHMSAPISSVCEYLKEGDVILWYQDGAEYGPRALGHRSFLADPSKKEMLEILNRIKGREQWRPLAPIVPEELFTRIFEVENTDMCEFMLRTLTVKKRWQSRMQAVCHIDGTTRPQLLKREINPQLYDLLMAYFERTHIPCLVNTSLNINGFPIVETPEDLTFLQEEFDFMEDIPPVKFVFVEENNHYELLGLWKQDEEDR